jgi:hypothetical protein
MRDGDGSMRFGNGNRYSGGWKDGKADGTGTYTFSDGRTFTGAWRNGCFRIGNKVAITVGTTPESCR